MAPGNTLTPETVLQVIVLRLLVWVEYPCPELRHQHEGSLALILSNGFKGRDDSAEFWLFTWPSHPSSAFPGLRDTVKRVTQLTNTPLKVKSES